MKQVYKWNQIIAMLNSLMTHTTNHCLIIPFYRKLKIGWYSLEKVKNKWECRTTHSRAGKQTGKYKDWLNIIDEKGNIENIDWKSIKLWKKDLTESNRVFIL